MRTSRWAFCVSSARLRCWPCWRSSSTFRSFSTADFRQDVSWQMCGQTAKVDAVYARRERLTWPGTGTSWIPNRRTILSFLYGSACRPLPVSGCRSARFDSRHVAADAKKWAPVPSSHHRHSRLIRECPLITGYDLLIGHVAGIVLEAAGREPE